MPLKTRPSQKAKRCKKHHASFPKMNFLARSSSFARCAVIRYFHVPSSNIRTTLKRTPPTPPRFPLAGFQSPFQSTPSGAPRQSYSMNLLIYIPFCSYLLVRREIMMTEEETTTITFYCPKELAEQIDKMAEWDKRTRSNWIVVALSEYMEKHR